MGQVVTIPKDVLNRLQGLARTAQADEVALEKAASAYESATGRAANSTGVFANELYSFVLLFAEHGALIEAQLEAAGIRSKESSSVFQRITRLAFAGLKDSDQPETRSQISKYARLVEAAHLQGMKQVDFEKMTQEGITRALERLGPKKPSDTAAKVTAGKAVASQLLGDEPIAIAATKLSSALPDGAEVQLLARMDGGNLIVYGALASETAQVNALLQKIGAKQIAQQRKARDPFLHIGRLLRLSSSMPDDAIGRLSTSNGAWTFAVSGSAFSALVVASTNIELSPSVVSVAAIHWRAICSAVLALKGLPISFSLDGDILVLSVDSGRVFDLPAHFEKKRKSFSYGTFVDQAIHFPISVGAALPDFVKAASSVSIGAAYTDTGDVLRSMKPEGTNTSYVLTKEKLQFGKGKKGQRSLSKGSVRALQKISTALDGALAVGQTDQGLVLQSSQQGAVYTFLFPDA